MSLLMPLIREAVIDGFLLASAKRKVRNLKLAAAFYAAACLMLLPMIGFLSFAGFLALEQRMEPVQAALAVAGILLALAMIFIVIAKLVLHRRGKVTDIQHGLGSVAASATSFIDRGLTLPIRRNPKKSLLAATVLGLLAARRGR